MRMVGKILKWIGLFLLSLIILFGLIVVLANTEFGKRQISRIATEQLGREVVLSGGIAVPFSWPPAIRVEGLTVANIKGGRAKKMAEIGLFQAAIDPWPLFAGRTEFPYIILHDSTIHLERDAEKNANWQFSKDAPKDDTPFEMPAIGALDVKQSHLTYLDVPAKIDIAVDAGASADEITITGKGTYLAKSFALKATGGSLLDVTKNQPYPIDTTITVGNTTAHAKGKIDDPMHMAGFDINLTIKGSSASDLFELTGIALPPTPPYSLSGDLTYDQNGKIWRYRNFEGRLGDSDLSGRLSFEQKEPRPKFAARLTSKLLDIKDLGPLIGMAPEKDDVESAEQKKKRAKQDASPYVIPDVPLDAAKLAAMDADVELTGKRINSPGVPLDDFFMKVTVDDRILKLQPIRFGTANGDVRADLTVNGRKEPFATDADFQFRKLSLARLMAGAEKAVSDKGKSVSGGYIGGAAKLRGTGKSLREILGSSNGAVGIGMEGGKLSNLIIELFGLDIAQGLGFFLEGDKSTEVRCIIGDFGVKNGLMKSNALVIDTKDTNVQGNGTINLKDERMNLRFEPHPKDNSLMTLRTPINIGGTLKKPSVSVDKAPLIAKGAAAIGLGVILTPVAGVLGLVDVGGGEDSNCGKLMAEMGGHAGTKAQIMAPDNRK